MKSFFWFSIPCLCGFLICISFGHEEIDENAPLTVSIAPTKKIIKIDEDIEFEVRIENRSKDTCRIPKEISGHFLPYMHGPDGKNIEWALAIALSGRFDIANTIELAPGCFYGQKCKWNHTKLRGTYTLYIVYISPIDDRDVIVASQTEGFSDSLPHYWHGHIKSNKIKFTVK